MNLRWCVSQSLWCLDKCVRIKKVSKIQQSSKAVSLETPLSLKYLCVGTRKNHPLYSKLHILVTTFPVVQSSSFVGKFVCHFSCNSIHQDKQRPTNKIFNKKAFIIHGGTTLTIFYVAHLFCIVWEIGTNNLKKNALPWYAGLCTMK